MAFQIAVLDDDPVGAPLPGGWIIVAQLQILLGDSTQVCFPAFDDQPDRSLEDEVLQRCAVPEGRETATVIDAPGATVAVGRLSSAGPACSDAAWRRAGATNAQAVRRTTTVIKASTIMARPTAPLRVSANLL